jgi:secreted Zn-dependent insulinase-like peptidase
MLFNIEIKAKKYWNKVDSKISNFNNFRDTFENAKNLSKEEWIFFKNRQVIFRFKNAACNNVQKLKEASINGITNIMKV